MSVYYAIDTALFKYIPVEVSYKLNAWPVSLDAGVMAFIAGHGGNSLLPVQLANITGFKISITVVSGEVIDQAIKAVESAGKALKDASHTFRTQAVDSDDEAADADSKEEGPVAKLINKIIMDAVQKRASDIHIEAHEHGVIIKYRIDGVLYVPVEPLDRKYMSMLVSRIKIMAELDIAERRVPQDGRFRYAAASRNIDCRVSTLPSVHGEDVVIRILDKQNITVELSRLSLDILGMDTGVLNKLRRAIHEPYGMILVTGPTGSGKTTTLYGAVSELNAREEKIITVEDPVEYQLEGIVQIPVNEKKGLTFARGLRSILRHDPDKIMIGEIRDMETAQIAVQAALTGHLVFSTVHANNVFDVVGRFRHMGLSIYDFVSSLNCIMAQRLVRNLCPACKERDDVPAAELLASRIDPGSYRDVVLYKAAGCEHCSFTGYSGRSAIVEFLDLSQTIKDLLVEQKPLSVIQKQAQAEGFHNLRAAAVAKFISGVTSLREINRVTFIE